MSIKTDNNVFLIMIDALASEYLTAENCPFIFSLKEKYSFGRVIPEPFYVFDEPVFTGCYSNKTKIPTLNYYNPQGPFSYLKHFTWPLKIIDKLPAKLNIIFRRFILELTALKTNNIYLQMSRAPFTVLPFFDTAKKKFTSQPGAYPVSTIFDIFRKEGINFELQGFSESVDWRKKLRAWFQLRLGYQLDKWLKKSRTNFINKQIENFQGNFFFATFSAIDRVGHSFGPCSSEIKEELKKIDQQIKDIYDLISEGFKKFTLILLSDHGMVEVRQQVDVLKFLVEQGYQQPRDFIAFLDSVLARFWFKDKTKQTEVEEKLKELAGGFLLSPELKKQYNLCDQREKMGDLAWVADPGVLIFPNYYQRWQVKKGMHGYFPSQTPYATGICLIVDKSLPRQELGEVKLVDLAPTILELLNIETNKLPTDGRSLCKK